MQYLNKQYKEIKINPIFFKVYDSTKNELVLNFISYLYFFNYEHEILIKLNIGDIGYNNGKYIKFIKINNKIRLVKKSNNILILDLINHEIIKEIKNYDFENYSFYNFNNNILFSYNPGFIKKWKFDEINYEFILIDNYNMTMFQEEKDLVKLIVLENKIYINMNKYLLILNIFN